MLFPRSIRAIARIGIAIPIVAALLGGVATALATPSRDPAILRNFDPTRGWLVEFDGRGFLVESITNGWSFGLALESFGVVGAPNGIVSQGASTVEPGRVEVRWSEALVEWYENAGQGLEHGFTLAERPKSRDGAVGPGPLEFALRVRGRLEPRVEADERGIAFTTPDGATVVEYSGLRAFDALGRELPAALRAASDRISIVVDDSSAQYPIVVDPLVENAYVKASNTGAGDQFGAGVAIFGDTLVVGAPKEDSDATGVNGDEANDNAPDSGAAYVFTRTNGVWTQQAYLKASNAQGGDSFGYSVAIAGDTLVVGAPSEDGGGTGTTGDPTDNGVANSGAAYVFVRKNGAWTEQAYLKASNPDSLDLFGLSVAIFGDTIVVGARNEDGDSTGVNGPNTNAAVNSGAAYVFVRKGATWSPQAYLKASNTGPSDAFGSSVAISKDTIVVGAFREDSAATGVDGDGSSNGANDAGAAYVFVRKGTTWSQQAYLKASNTGANDFFGQSVAICGETLIVGAPLESSNANGVGGDESDDSAPQAGAAYVFVRSGTTWSQQAYLKEANSVAGDGFGGAVAIAGDIVAVTAPFAVGGVGTPQGTGGVSILARTGTTWAPIGNPLVAQNGESGDALGESVGISGDTIVAGSQWESSSTTGIGGDGSLNDAQYAGAAYVFSSRTTLTLSGTKGTIKNKAKSGKDSFTLKGTLTVEPFSDGSLHPMVDGATILLGAASGPMTFSLPGGADWSSTASNGYHYESPAGVVPHLEFSMGFVDLTTPTTSFTFTAKGIDLPLALQNPAGISIEIGNDSGAWLGTWKDKNKHWLFKYP